MSRKSMLVLYRLLLAIAMTVIFLLATTPLRVPVIASINDKLNHAVAFFVLALLMDRAFPARGFAPKAVVLIAYGSAIELVQLFLPYRSCSAFDLLADSAGLVFYALLSPWLARLPVLDKRGQDPAAG